MTEPFIPRKLEELALDWPRELDHLSASSIKMAARCPEQWRMRYMLGKIQPPNFALIAGKADHQAIEKSMRQKIHSYVDLPVQDVKDEFVNAFEAEIEGTGGYGEIELRRGRELVTAKKPKIEYADELRKEGQVGVAAYHSQVSPHFQPSYVEHEFRLPVTGLPVELLGYIDLIAHDAASEQDPVEVIIDRKRSGRARTAPQPEWTIQAEVYQLAFPYPHEWHITVPPARVILPGADNELVQLQRPKAMSELLLQQIVADIGTYFQKYGPDNPWPARGKLHTWACNYCGYRPDCWGWIHERG